MKSSYLVGFDPQMKIWEVRQIFTEYPNDYWVFKVSARDECSALNQAVQCYTALCNPTASRIALYRHFCKKTMGLMSYGTSMLVVDVPARMADAVQSLVDHQLLIRGDGNQVLISTHGPLWKYLEQDFKPDAYATRREEVMEI